MREATLPRLFAAQVARATLVLRNEEMVSSPARFLRACGELGQGAMRYGVRLFNSYGPTEATPASSVFDPSKTAEGCSTNAARQPHRAAQR